jgi:hypothetical protein
MSQSLEDASPPEPPPGPELALAPSGERATLLPSTNVLERMMFVSNALARSGMPLPKGCRTAESIFAKAMIGWEHGLGVMTSLHEVHIIDGKASLPTSIKVGIIRQRGLGRIDVKVATDTEAVVEVRRTDWPRGSKPVEVRFTWDDAIRADLVKKDNWRKYPRSMLVARACDLAIHLYFQEVFLGLPYSPDELGAETDEAGRLLTVQFEAADVPTTPTIPFTVQPPAGNPSAPETRPEPAAGPAAAPAPQTSTPAPIAQPEPAAATESAAEPDIDVVRALADQLGVEPEHRQVLYSRAGESLQAYYEHLQLIEKLRWVRQSAGVDDFQYGCALDRRNVDRDYLLTAEQASGLIDGIFEALTPSERARLTGTQPAPQKAG